MPNRTRPTTETDQTAELLRTLLIVQLALAGVSQRKIRQIVSADINRVNKIVKALSLKSKTTAKE